LVSVSIVENERTTHGGEEMDYILETIERISEACDLAIGGPTHDHAPPHTLCTLSLPGAIIYSIADWEHHQFQPHFYAHPDFYAHDVGAHQPAILSRLHFDI
jgi:hypothetical protein